MSVAQPTFWNTLASFPPRANYYCPQMDQMSNVEGDNGLYFIDIGAPIAASATNVLNAVTVGTTARIFLVTGSPALSLPMTEAIFGRTLRCTGVASSDQVLQVRGYDFLGQPMQEQITLSGTTAIEGVKCFKYIERVDVTVGTGGNALSIGWSTGMGLPYQTDQAISEYINQAAATLGTFTAAVVTDPATATTGDPRGRYVPNGTMNGSNTLRVYARAAFQRKNLHGVRHFFTAA